MISKEDITTIGKFQKTHALKGELNMISEIDPEYFLEGNAMIVEDDGILVPFFAETIRPKGSTSYLVKLNGIDNEEAASNFVNKEISILKKDAEELLDDFITGSDDLLGYMIIDEATGKEIGEIKHIEDSTANVVFIVEDQDGEEIYLPANAELIIDINDEEKKIIMKIPDGLLDINN